MGVRVLLFLFLYIFLIIQRLTELVIANNNEKWLKKQGAIEVGTKHYPYIVMLHSSFFISLLIEVAYYKKGLASYWVVLFICFMLVQALRIWTIMTLGKYWNTKIIILPHSLPISVGPYKFIRHPNYLVVILELLLVPLIFNAYITAIIFTILNLIILTVRISVEERSLIEYTKYGEVFQNRAKFTPRFSKKNI